MSHVALSRTLVPTGVSASNRWRWSRLRAELDSPWIAAGALLWTASIAYLVARSESVHLVLALAVVPLAFAVVAQSPRATVVGLVFWLVALGLVRRFVGGNSRVGGLGDPLLLVGPAILVLLVLIAGRRSGFRRRRTLANAVGLLSLLTLVEAVNPLQGSPLVGLAGLLFVLVPMLAFWVGRALVDDMLLDRIFKLIGILAVLSALYGLVQQFAGFPSWDRRWINTGGYIALNVGTAIRAFASFSSAQEYGIFLSIGAVVLIARLRSARPLRLVARLIPIALVLTALVLESSRSALVLTLAALGFLAAARAGMRFASAVAAAVFALAVMILALGQLGGSANPQNGTGATSALLQHDFAGLAHPTGKGSSLSVHVKELVTGIEAAFTEPAGHGTGSVTLATRLGNVQNSGTEGDIGNVGVALGSAGLVLYVVVVLWGVLSGYNTARLRRDHLSLAALALLVVVADQWLNGDLYSVAWLVWLVLGWFDAARDQVQPLIGVKGPVPPAAVRRITDA